MGCCIEDSFETSIDILNQEVVTSTSSPSLGAFIRVRKNGFWFYQSTTQLDQISKIITQLSQQHVPRITDLKYSHTKQDPFIAMKFLSTKVSAISLNDKLELTKKYSDVLHANPRMSGSNLRYRDIYKVKAFLNSLGTQFEFDFNQAGIRIAYTLKQDKVLFEDAFRIYGSKFDDLKNHETELTAAIAESEKFLAAPAVDPGKYQVLLDPEVAGVFTHESFGHKSEADFILGNDETLKNWKLGKMIGSTCLSIVDSGTHINSSGYCPIDDDGTPAQKNYLIKNGMLTGRLHSVETAAHLNEAPTGNS